MYIQKQLNLQVKLVSFTVYFEWPEQPITAGRQAVLGLSEDFAVTKTRTMGSTYVRPLRTSPDKNASVELMRSSI
jgi:hypothetical protein